jgi:chemotaxis protein methyltransferase CheR
MTTATAREREYHLSDTEFEEIRRLVRTHTGISLAESKRELVYSRLVRRLRRLHLATFREYLEVIEQGDPVELEEFTNAITTNLTAFFREPHHFEFLAGTVLPMLEKKNADTRRLRIWSAGCSTGEEPYSIAITLAENMARFRGWDVRILATDLDSNVLAHGKAGQYREERFEKMPASRRNKWFAADRDGGGTAVPELKSMISFKQLNLMNPFPMKGPFDVIFCRNVVIYFDKPTQRDLFDRMAGLQNDGDHLFIGHSESLFKVCDRYQLIGKTIYRKER